MSRYLPELKKILEATEDATNVVLQLYPSERSKAKPQVQTQFYFNCSVFSLGGTLLLQSASSQKEDLDLSLLHYFLL